MNKPGRPKGHMRMDQVMDPQVKELLEAAGRAQAQNIQTPAPAPVQTAQSSLTTAEQAELAELRAMKAKASESAAVFNVNQNPITTEVEDDLEEYEEEETYSLGELTETIRELIDEIQQTHGVQFQLVLK